MILSFSLIMDSFWKTETLYFKGVYFNVRIQVREENPILYSHKTQLNNCTK